MPNQPRVFIENMNYQYYDYFQNVLGFRAELEYRNLKNCDYLLFTGGSDVSPSLYGEMVHPATSYDQQRDEFCETLFDVACYNGIPMLGICRGNQYLNVILGGTLWQHVERHTRNHTIFDSEENKPYLCSSTHHQMVRNLPEGSRVVAYAREGGEKETYDCDGAYIQDELREDDIEAVFHTEYPAFGFQPHPEFYLDAPDKMKQCHELYTTLLKRFEKEVL